MTDIVFDELNKGHWNIVILIILFVGTIMQLRRFVKANEVRHKEHERLDDVMSDNLTELKKISAVHENRIQNSEDDIKEIKDDIRSIKK